MLGRNLSVAAAVVVLLGGLGFWLTEPERLPETAIGDVARADAARGERIFWAGGCSSCHAADKAKGEEKFKLGGGAPLETDFGTFQAPNISPHPDHGLGAWSLADFANAMQRGVDPEGNHLYPAFPYTSYTKMSPQDVADLFAYLKTLPEVAGDAPESDLGFPFNIRRGLGLWKLVFFDTDPTYVTLPDNASDTVKRGQYLSEGPGHCGQCHTPRSLGGLGPLQADEWLAGAPNPEGKGRIPNITPSDAGIGSWSAADIAYFLESGFTPDFDSVGGSMVSVQENLAQLPAEDRDAIAAYLKAIPRIGSDGDAAGE